MQRKIAVLDLDSIAYSIGNGNKVLDEHGVPLRIDNKFVYTDKSESELQQSADVVLRDILRKCNATHYIGYVKGTDTTKRRKEVYEEYKANRPTESPKWWNFVTQDLINRWGAIRANNYEVDDYVNVTRLNLPEAFICAVDGDLLGLEGTHYNWRKDEWVTVTRYEAQVKFWGDMVRGQTGDNIKGIPGRGPRFWEGFLKDWEDNLKGAEVELAAVVLQQYISDLGEAEGIYEFYRNYTALKIVSYIPLFTPPQPIPVPDIIKQVKDAKSFFIE